MDKVLIVDHDPEMLECLKEGLKRYTNQFEIVSTADGSNAIDILRKEKISLVVTDLLLPRIGGLQVLAYMTRNYPHIPCIVMIEPSGNSKIRANLLQKDTLRSIEKPVSYKILASAIIEGLDLLDEGSTNRGIPAFSFFSLIQLKQETCLLQIKSPTNARSFVYFENGILFDASSNQGRESEEAVLELLGWENTEFSFLSLPKGKIQRKIDADLISLLEEANRRKLEPEKADTKVKFSETQKQMEFSDDQIETEVFIQGHPISVDVEEEVFVEISPGKNEIVKNKLCEITDITGFIAASIFSIGGELLESVTDRPMKTERVADFVFEIFKNTRKTFGSLHLGEADILDISTDKGEHVLIKGYMKRNLNFLIMIICDHNAQIDFFRQWLDVAVVNLSEDLKPC